MIATVKGENLYPYLLFYLFRPLYLDMFCIWRVGSNTAIGRSKQKEIPATRSVWGLQLLFSVDVHPLDWQPQQKSEFTQKNVVLDGRMWRFPKMGLPPQIIQII